MVCHGAEKLVVVALLPPRSEGGLRDSRQIAVLESDASLDAAQPRLGIIDIPKQEDDGRCR